ncbi:MAG: hypothetical protein RJA82_1436 [Pseudomonadota bacterium]
MVLRAIVETYLRQNPNSELYPLRSKGIKLEILQLE